jgi:hypothetical protein
MLEKLTHLPGIHLGLRYPWTKKINYMGTGKIKSNVSPLLYIGKKIIRAQIRGRNFSESDRM